MPTNIAMTKTTSEAAECQGGNRRPGTEAADPPAQAEQGRAITSGASTRRFVGTWKLSSKAG